MAETPHSEVLTQESRITFETACGLQRREDAVLSGTDLRIGFLLKDERDNDLSDEQKKAKATELATKLNGLKEDNKPILGRDITTQEILSLQTKIEELLKSDKFAGIFVNILGEKGQGGELSALAMLAFLDYINSHSQEPHEQLLKGAYEQVSKVLKAAGGGKISFAAALVDKKGELTAVNLEGQKILIFGQEKSRMKTITEEKEGDGTPKIQRSQLQNGDKIILCAKDSVDKIDRTKEVKKIVEFLTSAKDAQAVSGGERKDNSDRTKANQTNPDHLQPITLRERIIIVDRDEKEGGRKVSAKDYIKTEEYKQRRQMVDRMLKPDGKNYDPEVLRILPRRQNESDKEYEHRLFKQLEEELRNLGESRDLAKDNLYHFFYRPKGESGQVFNLRQTDLLTIAEATRRVLAYELNYQRVSQERRDLFEAKRQQMRTVERTNEILYTIVPRGSAVSAEGDYRKIRESGRFTPEAETDVSAFRLIVDYLGDQNVSRILPLLEMESESAEAQNYNETLRSLVEKARSQDGKIKYEDLLKVIREAKRQEKDDNKRFVLRLIDANLRHLFYHSIEQALQLRESRNLESINPFVKDIIQRLNQISLNKERINQLINDIPHAVWRERIRKSLIEGGNYDVLFSAALKGAEYLRRMAKEPVKLPQPEEVDLMMIIDKDEYQGLTLKDIAGLDEGESGSGTGGTPRRKPPNGSGSSPRRPGPPNIPAAPEPEDNGGGNGSGNGERKNRVLPPAPGIRTEPGGPSGPSPTPQPEPQPPPTELNIAFASVDIGAENAADVSRHITSQNEEIFRNKLFRIGKVRLDPVDLVADGLAYLSGKLAFKGRVKRGVGVIPALLANVPSMALGGLSGLLKGVRHPGHYFWQGMLFKPAFDRQRQQFASEMVGTVRQELVASSQTGVGKDVVASLPVKVSADLIDLALKRGSEIRNRNIRSRIGNWLKDQTYNIRGLFGGRSSEQSLAYKWLQEQIRAYKDGKPVDPEFLKQWQKLEQSYLEEQEVHGAKFTVQGALEETAGETRFDLKVENESLASAAEKKLKEIIAKYAPQLKAATDEKAKRELKKQLALEVNQYLRSDEFYGQLTDQQRETFSAKEIASNVTAIAEQVAQRWDENGYLEQKEDGKTVWDETHLNIFLARGAGGGTRGKTEYGGIEGIGQWREKLERRIAERSIGICSPGMSQAAERTSRFWNLLSRIGIPTKEIALYTSAGVIGYYGTAIIEGLANRKLMAGAGVAGAMAFVAATGGTGIVPVIGAAAGVGLVAAIKERSRLDQERYQMSREVALGRQNSSFALLRQEMIRGLVPPRKADELITSIKGFLEGDLSDPDKVKNFALLLTEITARLNITNLSQREGALQHLIQYEEGRDMRQNSELVTLLAQGRVELWKAIKGNSQLKNLVLLGQKADNEQEFLEAFDKVTSLTEAQLRFGSEGKVLERIKDWLKREKTRFGFNTDQEVETFVQKILPDWNLKVGQEKTIDQANRNFGVLRVRRMGQVFLTSVMTSGISWGLGELGITRPVSEIRAGIKAELDEYKQEGFNQWLQDWKDVVVNDRFDLEINGAGKLVADLTPFQRGVLQARNFFEPPSLQPIHTQIIDGIKVTLPGSYQWQEVNIGGKNYDGLVDLRTGDVIDMSHYRIDTPEGLEQFKADLEATGAQVNIIVDKIVGNPVIQHKELLIPQGQAEIINPVTGKMMFAPKGDQWHSEWRQDGDRYDLIAVDNHGRPIVDNSGKTVILIDNARLTEDGHILDGVYDDKLIQIIQGKIETLKTEEKLETTSGSDAAEKWKEITRTVEKKVFWVNKTQRSDLQELELYNHVYRNDDGTYGVILDANHMDKTIDPITGQIVKVNDIIADSARAPYGMQFNVTIPGIGNFVFDAQEGNIVDLNPFSDEVLTYCGKPIIFQGHQLTVGELAKMFLNQENIKVHLQEAGLNVSGKPVSLASEYRGWLDIFNIGNDGKHGFISAGFTDSEGTFHYLATIRGSGEINYLETTTTTSERFVPPEIRMINKMIDEIKIIPETDITRVEIVEAPLKPPPKIYWPLVFPVRETLEKSHPPLKSRDQSVRPQTSVSTDTTSTHQRPANQTKKSLGIDREALSEDLRSEYDRMITPAIQELIEALKSDDEKKIKEAKRKLINNLKELDKTLKKQKQQRLPKKPEKLVEDLEKELLADIRATSTQFEGKSPEQLKNLLSKLKIGLKNLLSISGIPSFEKIKRQLIKQITEIETRLKKTGQSSLPDSSTGQVQLDQASSGEAEARLDGGKSQEDKEIVKKIQDKERELSTNLDNFFLKAGKEEIKKFLKNLNLELSDNQIEEIKKNNELRQQLISAVLGAIKEKKVNEFIEVSNTVLQPESSEEKQKNDERIQKINQVISRAFSEVSHLDSAGSEVYRRFWQFYSLVDQSFADELKKFRENNQREPTRDEKNIIKNKVRTAVAAQLQLGNEPTSEDDKKYYGYLDRVKSKIAELILDEPAVKRTLLSEYEAMIKEINKSKS